MISTPDIPPQQIDRVTDDDCSSNEDYLSLKSMRLVNTAWSRSATPKLFRTVVVDLHMARWVALHHICGIQIVHLRDPGPPCHECGCYHTNYVSGEQTQCHIRESAFGELPSLRVESFEDFHDETYGSYSRANNPIISTYIRNGLPPPARLHLLDNVQCIETIGVRVDRVVETPSTRLYRYKSYDPGPMPMLSTALFPLVKIALRKSGEHIRRRSLHHSDELLESTVFDEASAKLGFPNLKYLDINTKNDDRRESCFLLMQKL